MNNSSLNTLVARAASCREYWAYNELIEGVVTATNAEFQRVVETMPTSLLIDLAAHMRARVDHSRGHRMAYLAAVRSALATARRNPTLHLEPAH